jgi:hypothetical protein
MEKGHTSTESLEAETAKLRETALKSEIKLQEVWKEIISIDSALSDARRIGLTPNKMMVLANSYHHGRRGRTPTVTPVVLESIEKTPGMNATEIAEDVQSRMHKKISVDSVRVILQKLTMNRVLRREGTPLRYYLFENSPANLPPPAKTTIKTARLPVPSAKPTRNYQRLPRPAAVDGLNIEEQILQVLTDSPGIHASGVRSALKKMYRRTLSQNAVGVYLCTMKKEKKIKALGKIPRNFYLAKDEPALPAPVRARNNKNPTVKEMVTDVLASSNKEMSFRQIRRRVSGLKGKKQPEASLSQVLYELKAEKKIRSDGKHPAVYSLKASK